MRMSSEEKERLADRVVALLKDEDPFARLRELRERVQAGLEGPEGEDAIVLALAQAMAEHLRR